MQKNGMAGVGQAMPCQKRLLPVLQKYTNAIAQARILPVARKYKISIGVFKLLHKLVLDKWFYKLLNHLTKFSEGSLLQDPPIVMAREVSLAPLGRQLRKKRLI